MKVPAAIRAVSRPKNTVVENNGRPGPNQYTVRERAGITYVPGGNPKPRNGKVIGHIIDHRYVPLHDVQEFSKPDMLSYGSSAFVRSVSQDLLEDLLTVFRPEDALGKIPCWQDNYSPADWESCNVLKNGRYSILMQGMGHLLFSPSCSCSSLAIIYLLDTPHG